MDAYEIAKKAFLMKMARALGGMDLSFDVELVLVVGFDAGWRVGRKLGYVQGHEDHEYSVAMMTAATSLPQEEA